MYSAHYAGNMKSENIKGSIKKYNMILQIWQTFHHIDVRLEVWFSHALSINLMDAAGKTSVLPLILPFINFGIYILSIKKIMKYMRIFLVHGTAQYLKVLVQWPIFIHCSIMNKESSHWFNDYFWECMHHWKSQTEDSITIIFPAQNIPWHPTPTSQFSFGLIMSIDLQFMHQIASHWNLGEYRAH